jgi:hypothetical protein
MSSLGSKLRRLPGGRIAYWCPGCEHAHSIGVDAPLENGARWTWDGDEETPTFSPSINSGPGTRSQCHHFVRAGMVEFLSDCWHTLAGQTVPLPAWPRADFGDE